MKAPQETEGAFMPYGGYGLTPASARGTLLSLGLLCTLLERVAS